jgi:NRPS condensation-like uncharacterized protein
MAAIVLRELCPSECRLFLLNLILPHNVMFVAKFLGSLDSSMLKCAIAKAQKKYPLLQTYIENEMSFNPKFCLLPNGAQIPFIVEFDNNIENSWEQKAEQLLAEQLCKVNKPLFKIVQVNFDGGAYVFFLLQHAICDGLSLIALFKFLLFELGNQRDSRNDISVIDGGSIPQSIQNLLPGLPDEIAGSSDSLFDYPYENEYRRLYLHIPISKRSTGLLNLTLIPVELEAAINLCKRMTVSLHSLICACLCVVLRRNLSHFKHSPTEKIRLGCNTLINVRPYLNAPVVDDAIGFYSSCILSGYELDEDINIWHLAKTVQEDIEDKKRSLDFIKRIKKHGALVDKFTTPEFLVESMRVDAPAVSVSNVGKIEIEFESSSLQIANFNIFSTCHAHSRNQDTFFLSMSTFDDKLSLNLHYVKPIVSRQRAKMFLDEVYQLLRETINLP